MQTLAEPRCNGDHNSGVFQARFGRVDLSCHGAAIEGSLAFNGDDCRAMRVAWLHTSVRRPGKLFSHATDLLSCHPLPDAAVRTASRILAYPVHLQKFPASAVLISSSVG